MLQRVEQTDEEIIKMYMECEKIELANMLLQSNKMLKYYTQSVRFKVVGEEKLKQNLPTFEHDKPIERESTFSKIDYFWGGMIIGLVISATLISIINLAV